jgi:hypothetical protein
LVTRYSRREFPRRRRGLPGSWRTPVSVPCSSTPAGSRTPGHCGAATRPSVEWTTSAPAMMSISGLIHTARSLAVYASQCRLPEHHARLASDRWPSSVGRGWLPAGFQRKVSASGFPLSQAFLAHPLLDSTGIWVVPYLQLCSHDRPPSSVEFKVHGQGIRKHPYYRLGDTARAGHGTSSVRSRADGPALQLSHPQTESRGEIVVFF